MKKKLINNIEEIYEETKIRKKNGQLMKKAKKIF